MAETREAQKGISQQEFWQHLDKTDSLNLKSVSDALKNLAKRKGVDVHLVAVGGMVDPARRGQVHKDIDLVLVSKELAIENSPSTGTANFDKFGGFLDEALGGLGWQKDTIEPYWEDFDRSSDGSITYKPKEGKPIEILPTRVDLIKDNFEEYLLTQRRQFSVIF